MSTAVATPTTTFSAPDDRTATEPPEHRGLTRDQVRLLVASPAGIVHARFRDLPQYLREGDLLVVNDSGTLPAELDGHWRSGRPVVVHLATDLRDGTWVAELRTAPTARSRAMPTTTRSRSMAEWRRTQCGPMRILSPPLRQSRTISLSIPIGSTKSRNCQVDDFAPPPGYKNATPEPK